MTSAKTLIRNSLGLALVAALALSSTKAVAKHHHGHGEGGAEEADEAEGDASAASPHAMTEDDEAEGDDAGPPVAVDRTAEQTARREQLLAKEHALVADLAHKSGPHLSMRARQAIGVHWRHVMRLSRIRELAEQDHDAASIAKATALLDAADKSFTTKMGELVADGGAK